MSQVLKPMLKSKLSLESMVLYNTEFGSTCAEADQVLIRKKKRNRFFIGIRNLRFYRGNYELKGD
jgi:hypothetical protein